MPKVGVVISMLGKNESTRKCVDSVITNAGIDCDIVVIDDGSEIPYKDNRVKIVRFDKPHGNTHSMNQGILFFDNKYDYIVNLDNDVCLQSNAIFCLAVIMDMYPKIALAGSARYTKDKDGILRLMGQGIDLHGSATELDEKDDSSYLCHWVCGASVMLRSNVIREIGMFDKRFKNYCQDSEWCIRALANDYRIVTVSKSKVSHTGSGTLISANNTIEDDRHTLLRIITCHMMGEILKGLPLEYAKKIYGRIKFDTYVKHSRQYSI